MTLPREVIECQQWLGQFPMTGRSVLQTRGIDLRMKGSPADGSGNGIGYISSRCLILSHRLRVQVDTQSRCRNSQLESRVRENRTHGSEGGEGESSSLPLSN